MIITLIEIWAAGEMMRSVITLVEGAIVLHSLRRAVVGFVIVEHPGRLLSMAHFRRRGA